MILSGLPAFFMGGFLPPPAPFFQIENIAGPSLKNLEVRLFVDSFYFPNSGIPRNRKSSFPCFRGSPFCFRIPSRDVREFALPAD